MNKNVHNKMFYAVFTQSISAVTYVSSLRSRIPTVPLVITNWTFSSLKVTIMPENKPTPPSVRMDEFQNTVSDYGTELAGVVSILVRFPSWCGFFKNFYPYLIMVIVELVFILLCICVHMVDEVTSYLTYFAACRPTFYF